MRVPAVLALACLLALPGLPSAAAGPAPAAVGAALLAPGEALVVRGPTCGDALTPTTVEVRIAGAPDAVVEVATVDAAEGLQERRILVHGPLGAGSLEVVHPSLCTPVVARVLGATGAAAVAVALHQA